MKLGVDSLVARIEGLKAFVGAAEPYLPTERLAGARAVVGRAGERLALSRDHTVVALAGATGSGKSSLFNTVAGADLSPAGILRPTTGKPSAAVWGFDGAKGLLDWLDVPPTRRHTVTGAGENGLVLLDLPDFDSVEAAHRLEVDRLLALVDLVVWVLDPEKYADGVVHEQYLAQFKAYRDITVVVLNQADRLAPADLERCLVDLRRLLVDDGLDGVPVIATSAVARPGVDALRAQLDRAVTARLAALRRLSADVDNVVADLLPLADRDAPADVDKATVRTLSDALAHAAGVPTVERATERAYVHRAVKAIGWPFSRWLRRLRPDPLGRLHLGGIDQVPSISPAAPAAEASVGLALRSLAEKAAGKMPEPWPAAVLTAARSRGADLTDSLDRAVGGTDLGVSRRPVWWRVVGAIQWIFALSVVAGLLWLGVRYALFALALPEPPVPKVGRLPLPTLLLLGGLLAGLVLSVLMRPIVRIAARRKGRRAGTRLRTGVDAVARDLVLAPVRAVLAAYSDCRRALRDAR